MPTTCAGAATRRRSTATRWRRTRPSGCARCLSTRRTPGSRTPGTGRSQPSSIDGRNRLPAYAARFVRELDPNRLGDHIDRLYRAAWALTGSREDAEDLVQDTFAKILTRPRFLRGEEDLWCLLRPL